MNKTPQVYIIAGEFLPKYAHSPAFINADTIARGLSGFSPDAVALKAGRILLEQIESYASKKIDFAFETTLSGGVSIKGSSISSSITGRSSIPGHYSIIQETPHISLLKKKRED